MLLHKMLFHTARRHLPVVAQKIHSRGFVPAAAISSTAASRTLENPNVESIRAQISKASMAELKSQLNTRNLPTGGSKSDLIDRLAKSLSGSAPPLKAAVVNTIKHTETGEAKSPEPEAEPKAEDTSAEGDRNNTGIQDAKTPRARKAKHQHNHPGDVPDMPDPSELEPKEKESPIRVPLTPDNKFARYHRHEVVPEVAKPLKPQVITVLPDASQVLDERTEDLAKVLEKISVEVRAHREQVQGTDNEMKQTVEGIMNNMVNGMKSMMAKGSNSTLYMVGMFPVDLVKDMMDDVMSADKQFVEEEKERERKREREENEEDTGPQVLTSKERTVMYTIGGLSVAWYLLGY